jgi:phosphatidylserine decarboxylase
VLRPILLGSGLSLATLLPLAWKWKLGLRRTSLAVAALGVLTGAMTEGVTSLFPLADASSLPLRMSANWILTVGAAGSLLFFRSFRDPERKSPEASHVVVSPADGEVIYVQESREGLLPVSTKRGRSYTLSELTGTPLEMRDATVIGIAMSLLDAHVNRAPIAGRVVLRRRFPGLFGSLRKAEMVFRNERMTTVIERDDVQVAVVQIASRLVRQIVSFVSGGQELEMGQRIGTIRFGSQVDLVLPRRADLLITVQAGQRVVAGQSVVAVFQTRCRAHHEAGRSAPGWRQSSS